MERAKKEKPRNRSIPVKSGSSPSAAASSAAGEEENEHKGLRCPQCKCGHFDTEWTRPMCCNKIRRRKRCRYCGHVLFTQEKADS